MPEMPAAAPVILHAGALGDLILTLHLAQRFPAFARAGEIEVYARFPLGARIGANPRYIFHDLERCRSSTLYGDDASNWRERVAGRVVLNALGGSDSRPHQQLVAQGAALVMSLDSVVRDDTGRHVVERWADRLAGEGHASRLCPRTTRSSASLAPVERGGRPTLVLHPGSGGREKCWPLALFQAVAERWRAGGGDALLPVGEVELERWSAEELATPGLLRCDDRQALVDTLRGADVYVGNDSGPTHLAAWLGVPTVALFGPTDPRTWRPLGPRVTVLRGCPGQDGWGLSPEAVCEEVLRFAAPHGAP